MFGSERACHAAIFGLSNMVSWAATAESCFAKGGGCCSHNNTTTASNAAGKGQEDEALQYLLKTRNFIKVHARA